MSRPCSVPTCKQPAFTPSGMRNFACKSWQIGETNKQLRISKQLDRNKKSRDEAQRKKISISELNTMKDNYLKSQMMLPLDLNVVKKRITSLNANQCDIENTIKSIESTYQEIDKLRVNNIKIDQMLDECDKLSNNITDQDVKISIELHTKVLREILTTDLIKPIKPITPIVDPVVNKYNSKIDTLHSRIIDIDQQLFESLERNRPYENKLQEFYENSKFVSVELNKSFSNQYLVCDDPAKALLLYFQFPNVFEMAKNYGPKFDYVTSQSSDRIIIVPNVDSFKYNNDKTVYYLFGHRKQANDFGFTDYQYYDSTGNYVPSKDEFYLGLWKVRVMMTSPNTMDEIDILKIIEDTGNKFFIDESPPHVQDLTQFENELIKIADYEGFNKYKINILNFINDT